MNIVHSKKNHQEENRPPAKGQQEEPLPSIARMLGNFLQHQRNNPFPNPAPTHLRPMLAYSKSELDATREGSP